MFPSFAEATGVLPGRDEDVRHCSADPGKAVMWGREQEKGERTKNVSKSTCLMQDENFPVSIK